jgi:hypothetical protein
MTGLYRLAVGLHVLTVLAGLAAVGVTAGYCGAARHLGTTESLKRFFSPGPGWAVRLIYPAAVFGLLAEAASRGRVRPGLVWVWLAGLLWVGAAGVIEMVLRPAQRQLGRLSSLNEPGPGWTGAATRGLAGGLAVVGLIVAASLVMTVQPG